MLKMVTEDVTAPYSAVEAWGYDTVIAAAVTSMLGEAVGPRLEGIPARGAVLDVGCGGAQNLCWLARRRPDLSLVGLDLSPRQVARARRRAAPLPAQIIEGSALDLPFPPGQFDVVLSVASIKHWPDQRRGLAECSRVLKPGGLLMIVEVDRGCLLEEARGFVGRWRLPAALRTPALAWFRTWIAGQGLDLEEARAALASLPVEGQATRVVGTPALLLEGRRR